MGGLYTGHVTEFGLRGLVIISLVLQIILTVLGSRRKYSLHKWLRKLLWFAYTSADEVAILTLGLVSKEIWRSTDDGRKHAIVAFWAPFLLLHLGGPDTITAYSWEDNQLWRRHFLKLSLQISTAFIVLAGAWRWRHDWANFPETMAMTLAIFVAGIIKYGERIWVQRSSSSTEFRNAMFPPPDPGPNYARYMDEYQFKKDEGYKVTSGRIDEAFVVGDDTYSSRNMAIPDAAALQDAETFFGFCRRMFADLILSVHDITNSESYFKKKSCADAFNVVEIELGFMYDVVYTKVVWLHSKKGIMSRVLSFVLVVIAFVLFGLNSGRNEANLSTADKVTSYVLLGGALALEIYSVLLLLASDWTMLWLSKNRNRVADFFYRAISFIFQPRKISFRKCSCRRMRSRNKRWSNYIEQGNLISFCFDNEHAKDKPLEDFTCKTKNRKPVSDELKNLIFQQLLEKKPASTGRALRALLGRWDLESTGLNKSLSEIIKEVGWSIDEVDFDESILLWHIATDLCHHRSPAEHSIDYLNSKRLSEYMLYLLVKRPLMLPNVLGQIRFQDTCFEAIEFFKERKPIKNEVQACEALRRVNTDIPPSEVKGDRSKSVLFDGCRLAKALLEAEKKKKWRSEKKWEIVSHVWVAMLSYAAGQCQPSQHVQQLSEGGELLTHVWLLKAHLGITQQFQISKGHLRAKLIVQ